jgi:hypothetical protein
MMRVSLLAAVVAALALEGCAATAPASADKEPYVEREYRTGSNIAAKRTPYADGVRTMSRDDIERLGDTSIGAQPMVAPGTR